MYLLFLCFYLAHLEAQWPRRLAERPLARSWPTKRCRPMHPRLSPPTRLPLHRPTRPRLPLLRRRSTPRPLPVSILTITLASWSTSVARIGTETPPSPSPSLTPCQPSTI